jgi:antitoxin CcdA
VVIQFDLFVIRILQEHVVGRLKVNLILDAEVADMARTLGLNMLRLAEVAIVETAKIERNRRLRADNSYALAAYSEEVVVEGLSPTRFRRFQEDFRAQP